MPCSGGAILLFTAISITQVFAAPKIEVDRSTFDCGTVVEGQKDQINAYFTIKNTGDALLEIENVRPGCGCTVVKFDTVVAPGKSGVIRSTVNLAGFHTGPISKFVTVISNAANNGSLRLTITAMLKPAIELSEDYISLAQRVPHTVVFACTQKDLRVTSVGLSSSASSPTATLWQSNLPVPIQYKWIPTDSTRANGMRVFRLVLTAPEVQERLPGQFLISTNNPDKPEIRLSGSIEK